MQSEESSIVNASNTSVRITEIRTTTTDCDLSEQPYLPNTYNPGCARKRLASSDTDTIASSNPALDCKRPRLMRQALWKLPSLLERFESVPHACQTEFILEILKKSSQSTLQWMNAMISTGMKQDCLSHLPLEITRRILSYLDPFSLSRASCVSRRWQEIIDRDSQTWIRCLLADNYSLQDPITHQASEDYKQLYARHHTLRQNWRKGRSKQTGFKGHDKFVVTCLQFDDDKIVSGADDSHINIYDTLTGEKRMTLEGHEGGVWALQYVGHTLVTGSTDRRVRVWDMRTGRCTHLFTGHISTIRCLLITQPTHDLPSMIVTGSRDSTLRVWRLPQPGDPSHFGEGPNPYFVHALLGHSQSVRAIAAHGHRVVSGSYDNTVGIWDIRTGQPIHLMEGHTQKVYSVVIDVDRNRCMSGSMDSSVRIWDMDTGDCLKRLEGHTVLVGLLGLTSHYLVSAAADATLRVWSPDSGVCQHALSGHGNSITCFQHDNDKVISGSEGGLKMWDIKTGAFVRDLITDVDGVWRVAFDQRRCIAALQRKNETYFRILDFGKFNL